MTEAISLERIGDAVDHLVTAPISNWTVLKGLPLAALHARSRAEAGGAVSLAASRLLIERVKPGDCVLLITGFIIRDYDLPETDGPIGAAVLGRTMTLALGATPVAVCEPQAHPAMRNCFEAAGLVSAELATLGSGRNRCAVVDFPVDPAAAEVRAAELLDQLRPSAVIAIERPAAGDDGHYHGGGGFEITDFTAKTDTLFAAAQARGIATIGIGDLGNELGMGVVADEVRRSVPFGEQIAASLAADVAVVANISNWGAYGVAACLAAACNNEDAFHSAAAELRLIEACNRGGAIDPVTGQLSPLVDGTDAATNAAMVDLLRSLVVLSVRGSSTIQSYQQSWRMGDAAP
ncbi:MAG: DUF4392 domain-containing protein [Alphaproteobacteria bacterium]|nr:DUF4392 domain-containing protein [Alphaproteobacteria bacterium]